jgi:hypothetical protein
MRCTSATSRSNCSSRGWRARRNRGNDSCCRQRSSRADLAKYRRPPRQGRLSEAGRQFCRFFPVESTGASTRASVDSPAVELPPPEQRGAGRISSKRRRNREWHTRLNCFPAAGPRLAPWSPPSTATSALSLSKGGSPQSPRRVTGGSASPLGVQRLSVAFDRPPGGGHRDDGELDERGRPLGGERLDELLVEGKGTQERPAGRTAFER